MPILLPYVRDHHEVEEQKALATAHPVIPVTYKRYDCMLVAREELK
jgi:hypothetical protein